MTIPFTIMTWNVENLFPFGNPLGPTTRDVYEQKLNNLAQTILNIAPDVLAVQEVGDPGAFADLHARLGGLFPYTVLAEHFDALHPIRVGIISRLPLSNQSELFEFPHNALTNITDAQGNRIHTMGRGALKVQVALAPGLTINLVTAHLKSKLISYPNGRRSPRDEAERARETGAATIRRVVQAVALRVFTNTLIVGNDQPLILLGDFNDGPDAVTTQTLQGPDDGSLARRDKFDDVRLYNLAEHIPAQRRYSRLFHKQRELIDHIMVSYDLIFRLRQADSFVEPIDSIGTGVESRRAAMFPDHAPLFARFELPEPSATSAPIPAVP
jgi:endonuclease/exonuclease/phosphatase family metal-dependent hydrolase